MATRTTTTASQPMTPRHLWLAGLGLAAVARREARDAASTALATATTLRERAASVAGDATDIARGAALTLREKIEPALGGLGEAVEARFAPLLTGISIALPGTSRAPGKARRPSAKKPASRRQPRKTAPRKARAAR